MTPQEVKYFERRDSTQVRVDPQANPIFKFAVITFTQLICVTLFDNLTIDKIFFELSFDALLSQNLTPSHQDFY